MLVTDDAELARITRERSLHGLDNDAWKRYSTAGVHGYEMRYPGFKYNMTDIQASLGLHQLARLDDTGVRRAEIWRMYNEAFADLPGVEIPPVAYDGDALRGHARHLYTIWVDWDQVRMERTGFAAELKAAGVGTGWHFKTLHRHAFYAEKYGFRTGEFPIAERISDRTVSLPLSAALHDRHVEQVIAAVRGIARRSA